MYFILKIVIKFLLEIKTAIYLKTYFENKKRKGIYAIVDKTDFK